MHNRQKARHCWLEQILSPIPFTLTPLAGDASFRQYFRLCYEQRRYIVMDAPPDKENLQLFLTTSQLFTAINIRVPRIHAANPTLGFAILDDFGDQLLLNEHALAADALYQSALQIIVTMQQSELPEITALPAFDRSFMLAELALFKTWFLQAYLGLHLSNEENSLLEKTFNWLVDELLKQPKVLIHRDYHSRNLMVLTDSKTLGVIDFQDAMQGPFTYDLVSLLKDCYIQWPAEKIKNWLTFFYENSVFAKQYAFPAFTSALELCGLQRHLKVLGIFSRLHLRDGKVNYLKDLPLTYHYVMACLESSETLQTFYHFLKQRVYLP